MTQPARALPMNSTLLAIWSTLAAASLLPVVNGESLSLSRILITIVVGFGPLVLSAHFRRQRPVHSGTTGLPAMLRLSGFASRAQRDGSTRHTRAGGVDRKVTNIAEARMEQRLRQSVRAARRIGRNDRSREGNGPWLARK